MGLNLNPRVHRSQSRRCDYLSLPHSVQLHRYNLGVQILLYSKKLNTWVCDSNTKLGKINYHKDKILVSFVQ